MHIHCNKRKRKEYQVCITHLSKNNHVLKLYLKFHKYWYIYNIPSATCRKLNYMYM